MGVDTTLKYGQYNTYKMDANEKLYADPFDVSQYSVITMQLVTIRTAGATTCEVGARWIDANNRKMGSDVLLTVNVLNRFSDWHHTLEVPEGAMSLQWWIKAGSASFNWACGKISPGSMPTAFSVDLTERTSMMTADGLYTSTIKADQVVSGLLRALNGGAWFDLDKPEIVMEGKQADLSITPENPLKLTDKQGNFIGGLGVAGGILGLVAGVLTNDPNMNTYATVGYPAEGGVGISIYEKNYPDVYMGRYEAGTFVISLDHQIRLQIGDYTEIRDKNGVNRLLIDPNGNTFLKDKNDVVRLWIDSNGNTFLQNAANSHAIGVDNSGPYFIKNGVKSYL